MTRRVILELVSPSRLITLFSQSECSLWSRDQNKECGELPSASSIGKLSYLDRMTPNTRWVSEGSCPSPKGEGRTPTDTHLVLGG